MKSISKFRWQAGGVVIVAGILITAISNVAPTFLTPEPQQVIIQEQK